MAEEKRRDITSKGNVPQPIRFFKLPSPKKRIEHINKNASKAKWHGFINCKSHYRALIK